VCFTAEHNVQAGYGAHLASYPMGNRVVALGLSASPHFYLVPMLKLSGATSPLSHMPLWFYYKNKKICYSCTIENTTLIFKRL